MSCKITNILCLLCLVLYFISWMNERKQYFIIKTKHSMFVNLILVILTHLIEYECQNIDVISLKIIVSKSK